MKKTIIIIFLLVFLFFTFAWLFKSVSNSNAVMNTKVFTSENLHVSLRFNKNWQPPPSSYGTKGRFEGEAGFFEVSCATGEGKTIDQFVKTYISNNCTLGTKPKITSLKIDNQPALLIMPSNDEPLESKNEAVLIVIYPKNIVIKGIEHAHGTIALFDYFNLFADKNHIMDIAKTIKFKP